MGNPYIRVVIADDHPVVLEGTRTYLASAHEIRVVGVVRDFASLLRLLDTIIADVVVLDLMGMGVGPITMVDRLKRDYPKLAIVIFSSVDDMAVDLMRAGVHGYVLKDDMLHQLVAAIIAAHHGDSIVSRPIAERLEWAERMREDIRLSHREYQVLRFMAQGLRTTAIADQMGIDPRTVQNHVTNIRRKAGCYARSELIEWYQRVAPLPNTVPLQPDHSAKMAE